MSPLFAKEINLGPRDVPEMSHVRSRLRMAVIGCGPIGQLHAQAIALSPRATLAAVCDPDQARRQDLAARNSAAAYASTAELFEKEKLDAVTVATPDHLHYEPTLAAIAAGCHVFCEKPLASNLDEAERMAGAAAERPVHLAVDYNRRFAFGYRQAHAWLSERRIGQLKSMYVRVTDPMPSAALAGNPHVILTTLLTHHFDLIRWYGGEVRRLRAHADAARGKLVSNIDLFLELSFGAVATIVAGYRDDQPRTAERMALHGTAGTIVVEDISRRAILSGSAPEEFVVKEPQPAIADPISDSVIAHVQAFIDQLVAGHDPPVRGRDGLTGMQLAAAAVESLASGRTIEMESL